MSTQLLDKDYHVRISSAIYTFTKLANDAEYREKVSYFDECHFSYSDGVNEKNRRV